MAKRKYSVAKTKKIQPAPLKLNYTIPAGTNRSYIDLARDVSRLSRRFVRQGKLFAVGNVRVTTPPAADETAGMAVYVSAMQNTWITSNAWHKSFVMWKKQQDDAVDEAGAESSVATFRDFKVYLDYDHVTTGNLEPVNLGPFPAGVYPTAVATTPAPLAADDWDYSQIVIPNDGGVAGNTVEYSLHMHGDHTPASKSMALGYQNSRAFPTSPDPVANPIRTGWMSEMFDVGMEQDDVVDNAQYRNNELPYNQQNYPGASANYIYPENKAWCFNRSTIGINTFNLGGMVVPCGLLRIDQLYGNPATDIPLIVEVELVPGSDKGYHIEDMQEM